MDSTPIKDITSQGIKKCKNLKFGKNRDGFFWGKKGHFIITEEGIPVKFRLTKANEDDARVGKGMLDDLNGLIIADSVTSKRASCLSSPKKAIYVP
ncbi:transposase [Mesotoga prima]|uniref:transposase n=1 Tax=Mesotoga prima TaxID=1184387 RepID=UPI002FE3FC3F